MAKNRARAGKLILTKIAISRIVRARLEIRTLGQDASRSATCERNAVLLASGLTTEARQPFQAPMVVGSRANGSGQSNEL